MRYVLMILLLTAGVAHAAAPSAPAIPGTILINVQDYDTYAEFQFKDGALQKTGGGDVRTYEKDGVTYVEDESDPFGKAYYARRMYRYQMGDRLKDILSGMDLQRADDLLSDFVIHKGKTEQPSYVLNRTGPQAESTWKKYGDEYYPNRQLTYAVYYTYSFAGALVDLTTDELSFPFGTDGMRNVGWSGDGAKVAYLTLDDKDRAAAVIQDIAGGGKPLRIPLKKYPYDITWSPDSSYIAVLTSTRWLGLWPWELLSAVAGHPVFHITFYLEIYDTAGHRVFDRRVKGGLKNGSGSMVWLPK
jgi:hypothetical protein